MRTAGTIAGHGATVQSGSRTPETMIAAGSLSVPR